MRVFREQNVCPLIFCRASTVLGRQLIIYSYNTKYILKPTYVYETHLFYGIQTIQFTTMGSY